MAKYSTGAGLSGAISGGTTGAAIGGPIGAGIGALGGFAAGLFGSKKKKKKKKLSTMDKRQQQLNEAQHQSIFGEGPLADLYNYNPQAANEVFDKTIGNPAYRNFQENIVPTITGQFRNQGLQNSSYVGGALGKAGRDVQENLNAQRAQYLYGKEQAAQSAKQNAVNSLQDRTTFDYNGAPAQSGFDINEILGSITPEAISGLKNFFGGK